jgi:hypothetical protein
MCVSLRYFVTHGQCHKQQFVFDNECFINGPYKHLFTLNRLDFNHRFENNLTKINDEL